MNFKTLIVGAALAIAGQAETIDIGKTQSQNLRENGQLRIGAPQTPIYT